MPDADRYLVDVGMDAPVLRISTRVGEADASEDMQLSISFASVPLSDAGSRVRLDRATGRAEMTLRQEYADEALLHPLLSGSCAILNWWHGRDAFHAGAFEAEGRAWVVIGDKGQGKSTTLGHLALSGTPILSDDLVVIDGDDVLPGPAFIDLRPDAAQQFGAGRDMGWLGARPRFRLDVPVAPPRVPLAGWLMLEWDDSLDAPILELVPLTDRLPLLFHNRAVRLAAAAPAEFVRFMAKPFFRLVRPKRWQSLDQLGALFESLPA